VFVGGNERAVCVCVCEQKAESAEHFKGEN
jgi:hypothetical protein